MLAHSRSRSVRRLQARCSVLAGGCALVSGITAGASACGHEPSSGALSVAEEASSGVVSPGECPLLVPANGAMCALPEGTTCDFGRCGTRVARCAHGTWQFGSNSAPAPPCPADVPIRGSFCPPCWPTEATCFYGNDACRAPDASPLLSRATCPQSTWLVAVEACRDGGGADVQRDGEPDAD